MYRPGRNQIVVEATLILLILFATSMPMLGEEPVAWEDERVTVDLSKSKEVLFKGRVNSSKAIALTRVASGCGCLTIPLPEKTTYQPGELITIVATVGDEKKLKSRSKVAVEIGADGRTFTKELTVLHLENPNELRLLPWSIDAIDGKAILSFPPEVAKVETPDANNKEATIEFVTQTPPLQASITLLSKTGPVLLPIKFSLKDGSSKTEIVAVATTKD